MADSVRRVCGGAADTHAGNFASGTARACLRHTPCEGRANRRNIGNAGFCRFADCQHTFQDTTGIFTVGQAHPTELR